MIFFSSRPIQQIWTVDVFNYDIEGFLVPGRTENNQQKLADWGVHPHFRLMQQGVPEGWRDAFDAGVASYLSGDWAAAIASLKRSQTMLPDDGPTASLLKQMAARGNKAPADWKRPGQDKGFRQLTSK